MVSFVLEVGATNLPLTLDRALYTELCTLVALLEPVFAAQGVTLAVHVMG